MTHEVVLPFCHPEYSAHRTNFRGPYSLGRRCITGRSVHDLTFDVLRQFMAVYPAHRGRIAFASFMEAHEGSLGGVHHLPGSPTLNQNSTLTTCVVADGQHSSPTWIGRCGRTSRS